MAKRKRTKKAYADLFDNPGAMFPQAASDTGMFVTLYPNGESCIWLRDSAGRGFSVTASRGPHGIGLHVRQIGGGLPMDVDNEGRNVEIVTYDSNPEAQAFGRWYAHEETEADIELLGPSYRRTPKATS